MLHSRCIDLKFSLSPKTGDCSPHGGLFVCTLHNGVNFKEKIYFVVKNNFFVGFIVCACFGERQKSV